MTAKPVRLQLSRRKGFRLQELSLATNGLPAVSVRRPSRWSNPFKIERIDEETWVVFDVRKPGDRVTFWSEIKARAYAVGRFRCYVDEHRDIIKAELTGKNVACTCQLDQLCHGDTLLELAATPSDHGSGK